ncbi:hypothetical protein SAMN05444143_10820 [Flavobacterium succinicans]|jgi:hypothetical protein|uniref:DUF3300 domain-containing protein n=1 Tax=Flavobacterium succinicans TaxID=29536 RepID=A0A1I4X5H9_9FLAO|nr:hypothetical protein [Flavobacterium succinicans]SFN20763.1 hypothetical protein SAMN05444143_10820 [Flavobacterium succinicans]
MKHFFTFLTLVFVSSISFSGYAQYADEPEALDLPGDNLNLVAVLDVFQKSKTLEDFETAINNPETKINNLDLNNDNTIDYIQVVSEKKDNTHFIVLQIAVNQSQKQDVAVIEVERNKKGEIIVQIIGDEELYGKNYIVEPNDVSQRLDTPNPGYTGNSTTIINNTTNNYSSDSGTTVSAWPVIIHLFSPFFIAWHSPWRWGYYPSYWRPWRPVYYYDYWGYHRRYHNHYYYRRTAILRAPYYRTYYSNRRVYSPIVVNNRVNGLYRSTYNGKVYKKPVYPGVRPSGSNRPTANRPTTLPSNTGNRPSGSNTGTNRPGTNRPTTLPSTGTNRPTAPNTGANRPVTLPSNQNTGSTRPVSPSTRPSTPSTRPTTRPASSSSRPVTRPAARPASNPVSRPAGGNRANARGNN